MLPGFVISSYEQYKEDTNVIAVWLASTARRCGYSIDLLQPSPTTAQPAPRSRRKKTKARKKAKEAEEQPTETTTSPPKPSYTIAIKDFVALAEFITDSTKPPVKIPPSIATVLNRAINVRKKHAQTLVSQQDRTEDDEDSDKRHSYFVGILEHVKSILQPYFSHADPEKNKAAEEIDTVTNPFSHLAVSEPSEAFINAPDIAQPSKTNPDYQSEQPQDLDEACTVFGLILEDFNRLRTAIAKTWIAYKIGMCDIVAASITTNTALEFARRLEEDVESLFEKHGGVERMLTSWYMATCWTQGQDPNHRSQPDDALNFQVYDAVTPFMWPTYQLLRAFVKLVGPTNIPIYREGFYGTYDPSSDRRKKNARQKHQEDTVVLMEILPEFALLCRMRGYVPVEDELVRGLRTAFDTHKISLSTILAAQVYLDIHHRMRDQIHRGLIDMEKTANHILGSIDQHDKFHASTSMTIDTWPRSNDEFFHLIKYRIETWAKGDPIRETSLRYRRPPPADRHLLSQHPLLCGLVAYGLKMDFGEAGIALANAWGATVCCAHLYNAVRQMGLLRSAWKDMDVMNVVAEMDALPTSARAEATPEIFLQRFMLAMGYSAANFAAQQGGRKQARPQVSRSGPRGLKAKAAVAEAFRARYASGGGKGAGFTHEEVRALLGKLNAWEEDADMSDEETEEGETQQFGLVKNVKARDKKAARVHQQAVGRLTVEELLEKLRNALQGEVLELSFDFALLHRFCWRLLRAVKDACAEELRQMYGPSYIEKESELPFIVGYILHASVAREQAANYPVFESRRTKSTNSQLLNKVAHELEEMIASGAGAMVAKVLEKQYNIFFEE